MELTELNLSQEQLEGVNKILQSESDKIRTDYSKKIKELEGRVPKEKSEAELSLEARLKVLEDKEKALAKKEQLSRLSDTLKSKGLDGELAKYLNISEGTDLETYIDEIAKVVGRQASEAYKPKTHTDSNTGGVTKEQFNSMGYAERANLYNTNRELYDILSK